MHRLYDLYGFRVLRDDPPTGGGGAGGGTGGSGGSGGSGGGGGKPPKRQTNALPPSVMLAKAQQFIAQHGNAESAVMTLLRENKQFRDGARDGTIPAGHKVVSDADVSDLEAYRALGKLDEVKKVVGEFPVLSAFKQKQEREAQWGEAAGLHKWNAKVLIDLATARNLDVVLKDEKFKEGEKEETRRVAYVRPQGDDKAALTEITSYAKSHLADYMQPLAGSSGGGGGSGQGGTGGGVPFPKQPATDQGSGGDAITRHIQSQTQKAAAAFNPLNAAPATTK